MRGVWCVCAVAAGCEGDATLDGTDADTMDGDCPSAEEFAVGMEKATPAGVVVTILDALPAPPYRGENTWTLGLTDPAGQPTTGAGPVVTPWMPLHGHGLVPADYAGIETTAGTYAVPTFDVTMSGQWEFMVDVGGGDSVTYVLCVEG